MSWLYLWQYPLSLIMAVIFILAIVLCAGRMNRSLLLECLGGREFSAVLLAACAVLMAIEGTWSLGIPHSLPFLAFMLLLMFSLGLVSADGIRRRLPWSYNLSHTGFFIMLFAAFFGAPDVKDLHMIANRDIATHMALSKDGAPDVIPFDICLKDFETDYYSDGISPKQYTSTLEINGDEYRTSVNHPARHHGYSIYQSGYDREACSYSVLKLVHNPWLPIVYLGMALMALGAVLSMRRTWNSKAALPAALALAVVFGVISLARIRFGTLMPALRSLWFVPHLIVYMIAYSLLAISLICAAVSIWSRKDLWSLSHRLLETSSALLLIGMLCGAVWAQRAWGDWWTWDGKECWAAATWMLTLLGTHLSHSGKKWGKTLVVLIAFLAMQITWYGVNWLPSAKSSLHTYNQQVQK